MFYCFTDQLINLVIDAFSAESSKHQLSQWLFTAFKLGFLAPFK